MEIDLTSIVGHLFHHNPTYSDLDIDGHDKLARFGIEIYGCVDAYSRKIIWFFVGSSNRTPAKLIGESQGGTTITLTMRIPEHLRLGPNLTPRASPIVILSLEDLAWPRRRRQALDRPRDARRGSARARLSRQDREDGYTTFIGISQPRE